MGIVKARQAISSPAVIRRVKKGGVRRNAFGFIRQSKLRRGGRRMPLDRLIFFSHANALTDG
jgi:hypothetical protein